VNRHSLDQFISPDQMITPDRSPEEIILIRNLTKTFEHGNSPTVALAVINLSLEKGAFLAIMGPSGSGKSTLLNITAGLEKPTSGQITVLGEDIGSMDDTDLSQWRNRHIGFVFQSFNLIPVLTALENVEVPLLLTRLSSRQRTAHAKAALEMVGLEERINHYPSQLSGGEEQRVAIARAIVTDPTLLLADEPTGNLDAAAAEDVMTILSRLNKERGKTIALVTHDPEASRYASVCRHLEKGHLRPIALQDAVKAAAGKTN
jgi:putative ABC transport system ATP-binding protein